MFQWDKTTEKLNVKAAEALKLFRSMREVQMALPGLPAQEASAYLCQYQAGTLIATVAVFHMHDSNQLAFYFSDPREVSPAQAESLLDQGLNFVESMGFLLSDMDVELMDPADRQMLWESLPLRRGMVDSGQAPVSPAVASATAVSQPAAGSPESDKAQAEAAGSGQIGAPVLKSSAPQRATTRTATEPTSGETADPLAAGPAEQPERVDDLLAAVEGLRAKRPGLAPRKKPPTPDEIRIRRKELSEKLGHILASL